MPNKSVKAPQHHHYPPQNQAHQVLSEISLVCLLKRERKRLQLSSPKRKTTWPCPHSSPVASQEESEDNMVPNQEDHLNNDLKLGIWNKELCPAYPFRKILNWCKGQRSDLDSVRLNILDAELSHISIVWPSYNASDHEDWNPSRRGIYRERTN